MVWCRVEPPPLAECPDQEQPPAAAQALEAVLSFPSARRIDALPQRLTRVRAELANPRFAGSARARDLDEQIEDFGRDTIVGAMSALPG